MLKVLENSFLSKSLLTSDADYFKGNNMSVYYMSVRLGIRYYTIPIRGYK